MPLTSSDSIYFNYTIQHLIMEELVAKIAEAYAGFIADATLQAEKGNKAAGTRARKASLAIEKLLKEYRKASIEAAK